MGYFEDALRDLARGDLAPKGARRVLRDRATFSFGTNPAYVHWRESLGRDVEIEILPADVERAVRRYLAGEWSATQLKEWAEFIVLTGVYSAPAPPREDEDYFDPLWDALHELASPEAHGPVTPGRAESYLQQLKRFSSQSGAI